MRLFDATSNIELSQQANLAIQLKKQTTVRLNVKETSRVTKSKFPTGICLLHHDAICKGDKKKEEATQAER